MDTPFNMHSRRFLVLAGAEDSRANFVTVEDLARVVAAAVDYTGEWPITGGIRGTEISIKDLIALGEKIRGGKFEVTRLEREDLLKGEWKAEWAPKMDHPSIPEAHVEVFSKHITGRMLMAMEGGAYVVGEEWNRTVGFMGTDLEVFLTKAWEGKE